MKKTLKTILPVALLAVFLFLLFVMLTRAQNPEIVASGGGFTIEKAAVAGGGNGKEMLSMTEHGTTGQTIAGVTSSGAGFSLYSGFWTPDTLAPTAANVSVGGRILTPSGAGVRNIVVTLTSQAGDVRSTLSTSLGYYVFEEVPIGETYLISVYAKRYTFPEPVRTVQVHEEITDVNFIAVPTEP